MADIPQGIEESNSPIEQSNQQLIQESQAIQAKASDLNAQERALKAPRFIQNEGSVMSPGKETEIDVMGLSKEAQSVNETMKEDIANQVRRQDVKTHGGLRATLGKLFNKNSQNSVPQQTPPGDQKQ